MKISVFCDDAESWILPYCMRLTNDLRDRGHVAQQVLAQGAIEEGDICFLLGCTRIVDRRCLELNAHNIVVHASDLPEGRGFSPLQWQILEGKNEIPVTLFEAVEQVDAGPYYLKRVVHFEGNELYSELRRQLGDTIVSMCTTFVDDYPHLQAIPQEGVGQTYRRRTRNDDALDIDKSLREQFNHLRIADNERFPLYFDHLGRRYLIKIEADTGAE